MSVRLETDSMVVELRCVIFKFDNGCCIIKNGTVTEMNNGTFMCDDLDLNRVVVVYESKVNCIELKKLPEEGES